MWSCSLRQLPPIFKPGFQVIQLVLFRINCVLETNEDPHCLQDWHNIWPIREVFLYQLFLYCRSELVDLEQVLTSSWNISPCWPTHNLLSCWVCSLSLDCPPAMLGKKSGSHFVKSYVFMFIMWKPHVVNPQMIPSGQNVYLFICLFVLSNTTLPDKD